MAQEQFARAFEVRSDPRRCWTAVTDLHRLVSWVRIVHSAEEIETLKSYTAVLEDRVGPFNLRADLAIQVDVREPGAVIDVSASGSDRALNSRIDISARLRLTTLPSGGTQISIEGKYQVTGRATTLGAGIVRKKGELAIDEFVAGASAALDEPEQGAESR